MITKIDKTVFYRSFRDNFELNLENFLTLSNGVSDSGRGDGLPGDADDVSYNGTFAWTSAMWDALDIGVGGSASFVSELLGGLFVGIDSSGREISGDISSSVLLDSKVDLLDKRLEGESSLMFGNRKADEVRLREEVDRETHEVQDSKRSLSFAEPLVLGVDKSSPVDLFDADYSVGDSYPDSYGSIDKGKNWFKVNVKKGEAQFVHSSGTLFKVDREGNVTMHVRGSFKHVVDGDLTQHVKGNADMIVDGELGIKVGGNKSESVLGSSDIESTGVMNIKGMTVNLN